MKILNPRRARTILNLAVQSLVSYLKDNNLKTIVLGISGGLDSAVMAIIGLKAVEALLQDGHSTQYIYDYIGIESQPEDLQKARLLSHEAGFELGEYDYSEWYQASPIRRNVDRINPKIRVADGNLKCRIRMLHLYDRAQLSRGVVLDTDDLSENLMGFWTRHGDVGDVKIIQNLTKDEVRDLGEYLDISKIILEAAPGDGLGVTDTNRAKDQLRMDYLKTDYIVSRLYQEGLNYNGDISLIKTQRCRKIIDQIAGEISESVENVTHVVKQTLGTAFKRKYGDDVINLLPQRGNMGLPNLGSENFRREYLAAINKSR